MDKEKFRIESIHDVLKHIVFNSKVLRDHTEYYENDNIYFTNLKFWVKRLKHLVNGDIDEEYVRYIEKYGDEALNDRPPFNGGL